MTTFLDPNDARLTAYALGELDEADRTEMEQLLAVCPELQAELAEITNLAGILRTDLAGEPVPSLTAMQRQELTQSQTSASLLQPTATVMTEEFVRRARFRRRAVLVMSSAASLAVGFVIYLSSFGGVSFPRRLAQIAVNPFYSESVCDNTEVGNVSISLSRNDLVPPGEGASGTIQGLRLSDLSHNPSNVTLNAGFDSENSSDESAPLAGNQDYATNGLLASTSTVNNNSGDGISSELDGKPNGTVTINGVSARSFDGIANNIAAGEINRSELNVGDSLSSGVNRRASSSSSASAANPVSANLSAGAIRPAEPVAHSTNLGANSFELSPTDARVITQNAGSVTFDKPLPLQTFGSVNLPNGQFYERREESLGKQKSVEAEKYEAPPENSFLTPAQQPLSTFSIDVDSASYTNVRRFLTQGQLPPPDAVRIEEMINYFTYSYPQPKDGEPFSVTADAAPCPWRREHYLARIALQARIIDKAKRPPTNLVFLLDVSGSMQAANKLPLVRQAMTMLAEELNERDRIAIVTYAGDAGVKLTSTPGSHQIQIMQAIESLRAGGSTNGAAGINMAYEEALKNFNGEGENRVILCTDGDFNVGVSSDDQLVELIQQQAKSKVFLSIFGFGMGNLKDAKLEKLADKGNGHYGYIDDLKEARRVFSEELVGTLYTIAKDVKIQVEFNPLTVGAYRLIGYENRALAAKDFNDDTKDAGEIGAGHTVTALYEIVPRAQWPKTQAVDRLKYANAAQEPVAPAEAPKLNIPAEAADDLFTVKLRYKQPTADTSVKTIDYVVDDIAGKNVTPSLDLLWAASVASFGMHLRQSQFKGQWTLDDIYETAMGASGGTVAGAIVLPLSRLDPTAAAEAMRKLFANNAPTIEADVPGRRLIVRGTAEQLVQVQEILKQFGEHADSNGRRREFLDLVQAARRLQK